MLAEIRILVLIVTALPAVLFVIVYAAEFRHIRHTPEAWHLLGFTAVLGGIAIDQLVVLTHGMWPGRELLITTLVLIAGLFLWQRLWMLLRHQVIPRHRARLARDRQETS